MSWPRSVGLLFNLPGALFERRGTSIAPLGYRDQVSRSPDDYVIDDKIL